MGVRGCARLSMAWVMCAGMSGLAEGSVRAARWQRGPKARGWGGGDGGRGGRRGVHVGGFKINRDPGRARPAWAIEEERQKEAKRQKLELSPEESCQIGCVGELYTVEHYEEALAYASMGGGQTLVVIDFWKPECGMCQYLLPIFKKVCKSETGAEADAASEDRALFFSHNVIDPETEELSELARKLAISGVPKFHLYKGGKLVEELSTRDKAGLVAAVERHLPPASSS